MVMSKQERHELASLLTPPSRDNTLRGAQPTMVGWQDLKLN